MGHESAPAVEDVRAVELREHDVILVEPHKVHGEVVGRREVLAEVARARYADGLERLVIDWVGVVRLPDGSPHTLGVAVYERLQYVTRLVSAA